jgi:dissimilatory sulfite reductase (desulfoviridin) alpha/beta subunit
MPNNEFLFKSESQEIIDQMVASMDQMKNNQPSHVDHNHQGMRGKLTISSYSGFYNGEKYFDWEMAIEQEFNSHLVPEKHRVQFTPCPYLCSSIRS